jgi:hypothetical protein
MSVRIAVVNRSSLVGAGDVSRVADALGKQFADDYSPVWGLEAEIAVAALKFERLGLLGKPFSPRPGGYMSVLPIGKGHAWRQIFGDESRALMLQPKPGGRRFRRMPVSRLHRW